MATQSKQLPLPETKGPFDSRVEGAFGSFVGDASGETQLAIVKELTNKFAWCIGSTYKKRYSGKNTEVTQYAYRIVKKILADHGYPI